MSKRVCAEPGCGTLVDAAGRCKVHRSAYERKRGTRHERGYDSRHVALRRRWAPKVATGMVRCARCSEFISVGERWDLGHDDDDRSQYRGPEHVHCNRGRNPVPRRVLG